jgi:hypothetical protein
MCCRCHSACRHCCSTHHRCPCLSTSSHQCPYILGVGTGATSVFVDLLASMLLHPQCRGGHEHYAHRLPNVGAPPSLAMGRARLLGSSTSNAAIVVTPAAAVVVLALLAFIDERVPPPIPALVARAPPHLSYISLSAAATETLDGRCAIGQRAT